VTPSTSRRDSQKLSAWESGEAKPTLKQLEDFARATYTPLGSFFLPDPPEESLPVPDFRTLRDAQLARPSPNLLDTIYLCEQRLEWYRDFARATGQPELPFVGSLSTTVETDEAADAMRAMLGFDLETRQEYSTWEAALRGLVERAEPVRAGGSGRDRARCDGWGEGGLSGPQPAE
jgi:transcriptional regulator with XRE-family HTH domain